MAPNDALHARQNKMAKEILVGKNGWGLGNAWSMMKPRLELTLDGVHFTGAGSKWITNTLLDETLGYASRRTLLIIKTLHVLESSLRTAIPLVYSSSPKEHSFRRESM